MAHHTLTQLVHREHGRNRRTSPKGGQVLAVTPVRVGWTQRLLMSTGLQWKGQVLTAYMSTPLSAMKLELLNNVRSRFKGLRPNSKQWYVVALHYMSLFWQQCCLAFTLWNGDEDLNECMSKLGLINVVPKTEAGDRSRKCASVTSRWKCSRSSITGGNIPTPNCVGCRSLVALVIDLIEQYFLVYNSLQSTVDKNRQELLDSARGVMYFADIVHNVATCEEDCTSACIPMVHHLR
ncbi:hypothetical protein Cgig2_033846 [Carnegiea gigantea]|uniref:Uncharacterized protein n=1 Tax=Carnegiea gigantea TaxID=171969 RepID=A0A9Q1GVQ1_9CARY|nr:hypothetical protein Cgig2_033846 [Carnegiea gigantea]